MARAARERLIHFGFTALVCIIPMWYPLGLHCFIHFPGIRSRSVFASFCREFEDHAPDMEAMVTFALRFNQPLNWNVSNGTNMS